MDIGEPGPGSTRATPSVSSPDDVDDAPGGVWKGIVSGLTPLAAVVVTVLVTVGLTVGARRVVAGSGFFAQQQAAVGAAVSGLAVAVALYALLAVRALRRVRAWQRQGLRARASAALWALACTAIVVAAPVLVAAVLPQHPAP